MATYVCPLCGKPGAVTAGYTQMDTRYATGRCREHVSVEVLIREDVRHTEKKKRKVK